MRFVVTFCIGVGATLAWQTYGDQAREMIADSYPQLSWLAPRAAAAASATTAAARPPDSQQFQELALSIAAMRQRVDQLAMQLSANQDQMARDITARMQAAQREILDKLAAAPPRPEVTAARKGTPAASSPQIR